MAVFTAGGRREVAVNCTAHLHHNKAHGSIVIHMVISTEVWTPSNLIF